MGCCRWIAGLAVCAGLGPWQPAEAQITSASTVRVALTNVAGVPTEVLERAAHTAARVFALSNIDLQWIADERYRPPCSLTLTILGAPIGTSSRSRFVLGLAPGTPGSRGTIAFAYYERIYRYAAVLGLSDSQMLGHVMAHELGHLLLPHGAHTLNGVMRGTWDHDQAKLATIGRLTFSSAEAALIRNRLSACASRFARD